MATGLTITQIIFGQLMGLFAQVLFIGKCHFQHENFTNSNRSNYVCPYGIDINSINNVRLHT